LLLPFRFRRHRRPPTEAAARAASRELPLFRAPGVGSSSPSHLPLPGISIRFIAELRGGNVLG